MKKFTGEHWELNPNFETIEAYDENGKHICDIADITNVELPVFNSANRDWKADARLIAAAPKMYELLDIFADTSFDPLDLAALASETRELLAYIDDTEFVE